ncbi:MAG: hypothetical protein KDA68_16450 [Planctomycetaceae bacterium]|nr:hypothetical protein [Planctomycetaceae bacterium]
MPLPERIRQIVSELESEAAFGYSEVALDFLGMSGDAMNQLISAFDKIRELSISDGKIHDASIVVGNWEYGITFFVGPKSEFEEMMFKIRRYIEFK